MHHSWPNSIVPGTRLLPLLRPDRFAGAARRGRGACFAVLMLGALLAGCTLGTSPNINATTQVGEFGTNPGNLRMFKYIPAKLPPSPAMVVVLHHCFQHAFDYLEEGGWRTLADRYGFVVLLPEQPAANEINLCFNWYSSAEWRGKGEGESIHQMVEKMAVDYKIDRSRVFVTGLSSGASMAMVLLATYPEVFAGGGEIGGAPFGCAKTFLDVPVCQTIGPIDTPQAWGNLVRAASPYHGPWPIVSVWHGNLDVIAAPNDAKAIVQQWTNVHGIPDTPTRQEKVEGYPRLVYADSSGRAVVEYYQMIGMGHSVPMDPHRGCGDGRQGFGNFVSDMHICSSFYMLKFWGLVGADDSLQPGT